MNGITITTLFQRLPRRIFHLSKRHKSQDFQYNLSEDIVTTAYNNVFIIGFNLRDSLNALNDSALDLLNQKLKDFSKDDQYTVAVLHGIGGNFCTGIQKTANEDKAQEIIKTLHYMKKPTIATLTGYTTFFGFQLAIMCDFRVMEVGSLCGFGLGKKRSAIYPVVCKRLLAITNLSATLDFVLNGGALTHNAATSLGLVNRIVESGTGLGKSINMAKSIAKFPLDDVIKHRDLIYSLMATYSCELD